MCPSSPELPHTQAEVLLSTPPPPPPPRKDRSAQPKPWFLLGGALAALTCIGLSARASTVVSNLDNDNQGSSTAIGYISNQIHVKATGFTTGNNVYALKSVTARFSLKTGSPANFKASLYSNSNNKPGLWIVDLSGSAPNTEGNHTYTCSGNSCALAANTTYHLVFSADNGSNTGNAHIYSWSTTSSTTETRTPSNNGWSIADSYSYSENSGATWYSVIGGNIGQFSVNAEIITLTASMVEDNTATLTITNNPSNWYYQYTSPSGGTCSTNAVSTTTVNLTGLTSGTSYTFKAYSDSSCNREIITESFTTAATNLCGRTPQIRDAIIAAVSGKTTCQPITNTDLAGITSLTVTNQSSLTTLKAGDFAGLNNLEKLDLNSNRLSSLPAGIFDNLTSLEYLDLSYNYNLSSLPDGIFNNLTSLKRLFLSYNKLSSLPADVFDNLTSVQRLYLIANELSSLPAGVFDDLTSVKWLRMSDNKLSSLPAGVFDNLTSLKWLDLFNNKLTTLPPGIFDGFTSPLTTLNLNYNRHLSCLPRIPPVLNLYLYYARWAYRACGAGVTVSPDSVFVGQDDTATYTMVLDAYPTGNVTVTPASSATGTAAVSGPLTFTQNNWSTPQSVTVTGVAVGSATISHTIVGGGYGSATAADIPVTVTAAQLTVSGVKETTATLTIANHTAVWWYKGSQSGATCTSVAANTTIVNLSGLTGDTSYTYKAYKASGCNNVDLIASTPTFFTPQLTATAVTDTTATLNLINYAAAWWYKGNQNNATCTSVAANTTTTNLSNLTAGTKYTYTAYSNSSCSTELTSAIADAEFSTVNLTAGLLTATGATLTIVNWTGVWWHKGSSSTCTSVGENTSTAVLSGLTAGTNYTWKAYSASGCSPLSKIGEAEFTTQDLSVSITGVPAMTNTTFTVTFTFSAAVTGFEITDIKLGNATVANFSGSSAVYTAEVTPTGNTRRRPGQITPPQSIYSVWVAADSAVDANNVGNDAAIRQTGVYDAVPTLSIVDMPEYSNGTAFTVRFVFSEAVTGFEASDVSLTGATMSGFSGSGASYSATITPSADYTISIASGAAQDATGNVTPARSRSGIYDTTRPSIVISDVPRSSNGTPFIVTFTFSEPVTGFATSNTIDATVTGATVSNILGTGDGSIYTAQITPTGGYSISVGENVAYDDAGNGNTASATASGTYDTTRPTIAISGVPNTTSSSFIATFTFSENVTGFTAGDITLSNATASNFSGSGTTYTATIMPVNNGAYSVSVPADAAEDDATNGNTASATASGTATLPVTLRSSVVEDDTATLTIANHDSNWYYQYTSPTGGSCSTLVSSGTTTVSLLTPATSYTFKAYSDNNCTTELTSDTTDAKFLTKPGQVTGVTTAEANSTLNVSWNVLSGTLTGYKVQWKSGQQNYNTGDRQKTGISGITTTISGLTNNTSYTVRVTAYNTTGDGAPSSEVTGTPVATTVPSPTLTVTGGNRQLDASWTDPLAGLPEPEAYRLRYRKTGSSSWTYVDASSSTGHQNFGPSVKSTTVPGFEGGTLEAGATYEVEVRAGKWNDGYSGWGLWSATKSVLTLPAQVIDMSVTSGDNSLGVSWTALTGTITGYKVQWKSSNENYDSSRQKTVISGTTTTISGLTNDTSYTVQVMAYNATGDGTASTEATGTPTAPTMKLSSPRPASVPEGGSSTYTVVLGKAPAANMTIAIANRGESSDDSDLTVDPTSLSFTTSNWNIPQTVTLSAEQDDDTTNGSAVFTHTASRSDLDLNSITYNLTVSEDDDDEVGVMLSKTALEVAEGGSATYIVRLTALPTATVTINVAKQEGDDSDLTIHPRQLTFTTQGWDLPQEVTISATQDFDVTNGTATITHTATSSDTSYNGITIPNISATEVDDDTQSVMVSKTNLSIPEGSSATYTVVLDSQPEANVIVAVSKATGGADNLAVNPASLTFTTSNWNLPQTVTVSANSDVNITNGTATINHTATSSDTNYNGITIASVSAAEVDDQTGGIRLSSTTLTIPEGGSTSFTVVLAAQPTNRVLIVTTFLPGYDLDFTSNLRDINFTTESWNTPQTFTVSAKEDDDGKNGRAEVVFSGVSLDSNYNTSGLVMTFTEEDNDAVGLITSPTGLDNVDEGGSQIYTVRLATQPEANVTVAVANQGQPTDDSDLTVAPASLTFTNSNWNTPQTITVSAAEDDDGLDGSALITHTLTSTDTDYNGLSVPPQTATEVDNDKVRVSTTSITIKEESSTDYTIVLADAPTANVTVTPTRKSGDTDITTSGTALTFTSNNWSTPQTVSVTASLDQDETDDTAMIGHTVTSTDTRFNGTPVPDVTVTAYDDDGVGLTVSTPSLQVPEGGTATYTAALKKAPTNNVTVNLSTTTGSDSNLTVNPSTLSFTSTDWSTAQTVTVTATQDADGQEGTANILHAGASTNTDTSWRGDLKVYNTNGIPFDHVTVSEDDDETPAVTLIPTSLTVAEGGTGTYTVKLATAPVASVTITVANRGRSNDDVSLTVNPSSLTFTTNNYGTAQTVTISAAEDLDSINGTAAIIHTATSGDSDYSNLAIDNVTVTENDNDSQVAIVLGSPIVDQVWYTNEAIPRVMLPTATGGNGTITYTLTPALPTGVTFDDDASHPHPGHQQGQQPPPRIH